jgi:ankyrin repeat protein
MRISKALPLSIVFVLSAAAIAAPRFKTQLESKDSCSSSADSWRALMKAKGIRSASVVFDYAVTGDRVELKVIKVLLYSTETQIQSTEVADSISSLSPEESILRQQIVKTASEGAIAALPSLTRERGYKRSFGRFYFPVYDDPCHPVSYFQPTMNDPDETALLTAAGSRDLVQVQKLLVQHVSLEAHDQDGSTPLLRAASVENNLDVVQSLIAAGANLNAKDKDGMTPLMKAAFIGQAAIVRALTLNGAKVNEKDVHGNTALMYASMVDNQTVEELLNKSASPNVRSVSLGVTPLILAVKENHGDIVKTLLAAGADKSISDKYGKTALDYANQLELRNVVDASAIKKLLRDQSSSH